MKKIAVTLLTLLLCCIGLQGCASNSAGKSDTKAASGKSAVNLPSDFGKKNSMEINDKEKQALRKFYDETWAAMVAKDMKRLDEQHTEQFVLVHMTGMRQPKKEFLKAIETGDLNYYKSVPEKVMITVSGDTAKIIGQNRVTAAAFGGSTNVWRLQLTFDAVKENGKWRMTHCRASTY